MNFINKKFAINLFKSKKIKKEVSNLYEEIFKRSGDSKGVNFHLFRILSGQTTLEDLRNEFKNSLEYKITHPVEDITKLSPEERMKAEWNARAKMDTKFAIFSVDNTTEEDFWKTGIVDRDMILGNDGIKDRDMMFNGGKRDHMKCLEIGCAIGRILVPMSKKFEEAIGVDVSNEMVNEGQKHVKDIKNCKIIQNSGSDLSMFSDNYFDFCYSYIVFQHITEKIIVEKYITEVSRILKKDCVFRLQVRGIVDDVPDEITTWNGVQYSSQEMNQIVSKNGFEVVEEEGENKRAYWFTLKCIK